jgi:hypothetical protein
LKEKQIIGEVFSKKMAKFIKTLEKKRKLEALNLFELCSL